VLDILDIHYGGEFVIKHWGPVRSTQRSALGSNPRAVYTLEWCLYSAPQCSYSFIAAV